MSKTAGGSSDCSEHARRPLESLLEDLAGERPAPRAGRTAAWTTAFAASLIEMVATITLHRDAGAHERDLRQVLSRAREIRTLALKLAERELTSYEPVIEAMSLSADDGTRGERVSEALSDASETPLEVARAAADIAQLATEARRAGRRSLEGEATTAVLLAEAACQAAARLVAINLAGHPEDGRIAEAAATARRAARIREDQGLSP